MTANLLEILKTRRSSKIATLKDPGPTSAQIQDILTIGARVPDHGKYHPWYFVVFEGDARRAAGELLRKAYAIENPDAAPAKLDYEAEQFLRAPVVIMVVSRIREGKNPLWEQYLSAGAVCHNINLAANALGFGSNWVTEWQTYSPALRALLGLDSRDNIAGIIYIGTASEKNEERERPSLDAITTYWTAEGQELNKGDTYGQIGKGYPKSGITE